MIDPTNDAFIEANDKVTKARMRAEETAAALAKAQKAHAAATREHDKLVAEADRLHAARNPQLDMRDYIEAEKKRRAARVAEGKIKR